MTPILALAAAVALAAPDSPPPRIVVDAGHGGAQEGAHGAGGSFEKTLALDIALKLKTLLERGMHADVVLTRTDDVVLSLADRVALANRAKPDLFLSIHANSMPTRRLRARIEGVETFFLSANASGAEAAGTADRENAESARGGLPASQDTLAFILADLQRSEAHADSSRLAYAIHTRLVEATHAVDRGVQQAPFYVLTGVEAPAVLVEVGFVSHPEEVRRLLRADYQQRLAEAIADGVKTFLAQVDARDHRAARLAGATAP